MNVLVFPTDDRSGQASIIYHYAKLGHKVFVPKHGTLGLNWPRIATWPALLYKSTLEPTKRNLDVHGFIRENDQLFGEDYFLSSEINGGGQLYPHDVTCTIIDFESENPNIDVFHTLRGAENYLAHYFEIAKKYFPNAKWVSSTFNTWTITPGGYEPNNVAKLIPANYENAHQNKNNVSLMCCDFECDLLGIKQRSFLVDSLMPFASFNHNFHIRQPDDYKIFVEMNEILQRELGMQVPNFGGNVRAQGADIRFSGEKGLTGQWGTLSPKDAISLMSGLRAVVHFKQTDWGGGVFYHALNTWVPIITTERYVDASNAKKYLIDGQNAIYVNNGREAADAVIKIAKSDHLAMYLGDGMGNMHDKIFNDAYWQRWSDFLERLV